MTEPERPTAGGLSDVLTEIMLRLPTSTAAEMALVGALCWGSPVALQAARATDPDQWSDTNLAHIARTCLQIADRDRTPDPITVKAVLEAADAIAPVGGWGLLIVECLACCTVPAAAPGWADLIRKTAQTRDTATKAVRALQAAWEGETM
ncbi:MAG: hypothetical protein LBL55_06805 [Propionibacteriaceae bacterium]|jgi:hypothetical protein|nr:hypothetical protein [Propionibacteriaceae bacterium]